MEKEDVIVSLDAESIYEVPLLMKEQGLDVRVIQKLQLQVSEPNLERWMKFLQALKHPQHKVRIALVGKYVDHHDAYKSIVEAFVHAGAVHHAEVELDWVQSDDLYADDV
ncbi:CTP synthase, partial [Arthrospira platensis SPKY1]|nr:CTP synthase [Arthrospira platensis SPKY1]